MEDSMEATVTTEEATKAAGIWIRAFMRAANRIGDQRQVIKAQEAKIAEQAALLEQRQATLDRCNEALKAQAFQLGKQDRELMQLRSKLAKLQAGDAGDLGRLRQSVDFQAMEIQRLKAALWYGGKLDQVLIDILGTRPLGHEDKDGIWCWCDPEMDQAIAAKLDAYKGKVAALTEDLAERDRLLSECQAERDEAKAAARRGTDEAKRLAAIAEHSNNLAQNRLEEAAKLRRQVAELGAEVSALKGDAMIKTHYAAGLMDSVKALAAEVAELKAAKPAA